jgi:hypothetical protein
MTDAIKKLARLGVGENDRSQESDLGSLNAKKSKTSSKQDFRQIVLAETSNEQALRRVHDNLGQENGGGMQRGSRGDRDVSDGRR